METLTNPQIAKLMGYSPHSLTVAKRFLPDFPKGKMQNRMMRYPKEAIEQWMNSHDVVAEMRKAGQKNCSRKPVEQTDRNVDQILAGRFLRYAFTTVAQSKAIQLKRLAAKHCKPGLTLRVAIGDDWNSEEIECA